MPNTYTQLHIHLVFAVKNREYLIHKKFKESLYKYICTIIQNNNHKILGIGGMPDHIHILLGLRPEESISHLVQEIKRDSSKWINSKNFMRGHFEWQEGFGAFSYSKSQIPSLLSYINNQEKHHSKTTFLEEYIHILEMFEIPFDEKYIFKQPQ